MVPGKRRRAGLRAAVRQIELVAVRIWVDATSPVPSASFRGSSARLHGWPSIERGRDHTGGAIRDGGSSPDFVDGGVIACPAAKDGARPNCRRRGLFALIRLMQPLEQLCTNRGVVPGDGDDCVVLVHGEALVTQSFLQCVVTFAHQALLVFR
jgi:hypothetical protein